MPCARRDNHGVFCDKSAIARGREKGGTRKTDGQMDCGAGGKKGRENAKYTRSASLSGGNDSGTKLSSTSFVADAQRCFSSSDNFLVPHRGTRPPSRLPRFIVSFDSSFPLNRTRNRRAKAAQKATGFKMNVGEKQPAVREARGKSPAK